MVRQSLLTLWFIRILSVFLSALEYILQISAKIQVATTKFTSNTQVLNWSKLNPSLRRPKYVIYCSNYLINVLINIPRPLPETTSSIRERLLINRDWFTLKLCELVYPFFWKPSLISTDQALKHQAPPPRICSRFFYVVFRQRRLRLWSSCNLRKNMAKVFVCYKMHSEYAR